MTDETPQLDPTGDDDSFVPKKTSPWIPVAIVGALVAFLALAPMLLGAGPFGLRFITSSSVPVHVLNTSGQNLTIEVPFATPLESPGGTFLSTNSLSGPITLRAIDESGEVVEEVEVDARGEVIYNVLGSECLAVMDASTYYGADGPGLVVVDRITQDTRVYVTEADTVILPRRTMPDQAEGEVHWIEPINCETLDPSREEELLMWAEFRLRQRRERLEDARDEYYGR